MPGSIPGGGTCESGVMATCLASNQALPVRFWGFAPKGAFVVSILTEEAEKIYWKAVRDGQNKIELEVDILKDLLETINKQDQELYYFQTLEQ